MNQQTGNANANAKQNFDLNIQNYTLSELENILELPGNYDENMIEIQETKLRQSILNDSTIPPETKNSTLNFIQQVKVVLKKGTKKEITQIYNMFTDKRHLDTTLHPSNVIDAGSTSIINPMSKGYSNSLPSEYYQGVINPLVRRILRQNINIDTRFRDNYFMSDASNFQVELPIKLTKVVSLQLTALEFSNTFYNISKALGNNYFVLDSLTTDLNSTVVAEMLVVIIPDGTYSTTTLITTINTILAASSYYKDISFIVDPITNKTTIYSTSGSYYFSVIFEEEPAEPLPLKLGWILGFRHCSYTKHTTYTSEGQVNINGPRYFYLAIDDYNNNVNNGFIAAFNSSILNNNILARVAIEPGNIVTALNDNLGLIANTRQYFGPVDIQKLHVQLLDEYGRVLSLNNMDYSFCLTLQTIYDL
jgi:hypothetical protein